MSILNTPAQAPNCRMQRSGSDKASRNDRSRPLILVLGGIFAVRATFMEPQIPRFLTAPLIALVAIGGPALAREARQWAFNAPPAKGYGITLNSIDPAPGTPLTRGSEVTITASVTYQMSVANQGRVVLVCQERRNRCITETGKQVTQTVMAPSGTATLTQKVTIPTEGKEIRIFIPLVPAGLTRTTGEVTVRYPLVGR
jgi:hypothetical protein